MKTDLYTKTILTIIAICLVWIGVNMTPSVLANREDNRHGFICGSKNFVKQIKDRYISGDPDPALPQQKSRLALLNHRSNPDTIGFHTSSDPATAENIS